MIKYKMLRNWMLKESNDSPTKGVPLLQKRGIATLVSVLMLLGASPLAHAQYKYIKWWGKDITWSNTKLGGGPYQPTGWVKVDVPPGFTGDTNILASSAVVYGSPEPLYQTLTWQPFHLAAGSKVSFKDGEFADMNLVYHDAENERLLVVSGPPTANAAIVATSLDPPPLDLDPPCVYWPGFGPEPKNKEGALDFCGARVAIKITTTLDEPVLNTAVRIPATPSPTYPARAKVNVDGSLEFNINGGLYFDGTFSRLNTRGPYLMTVIYNWEIGKVNEPTPWKERVWFTKFLIHHDVAGQTTDGNVIDHMGDDDYWLLSGDKLSWNNMKAFTVKKVSTFCKELGRLGIGTCDYRWDVRNNSGSLALGIFDSSSALGMLSQTGGEFLIDLSQMGGLQQLSDTFGGSMTHRAVTVPVLESQE